MILSTIISSVSNYILERALRFMRNRNTILLLRDFNLLKHKIFYDKLVIHQILEDLIDIITGIHINDSKKDAYYDILLLFFYEGEEIEKEFGVKGEDLIFKEITSELSSLGIDVRSMKNDSRLFIIQFQQLLFSPSLLSNNTLNKETKEIKIESQIVKIKNILFCCEEFEEESMENLRKVFKSTIECHSKDPMKAENISVGQKLCDYQKKLEKIKNKDQFFDFKDEFLTIDFNNISSQTKSFVNNSQDMIDYKDELND